MATTVLDGLDEVRAAVGRHLGHSEWLEITQERVDLFADATGGDQRGSVAPGYLTVSLSNLFLPQIVEVRGVSMGVNYGTGTIRFPVPVPVGSRLRGGAELVEVEEIAGGVQTLMRITIEVEGRDEPACVIDSISRWIA